MKIICSAKLANTTVGHVDHAMAYAAGFRRMGHDVVVVDHVGRNRCVDAAGHAVPFERWDGRDHFEAIARRYGVWPRCSLVAWDRRTHGVGFDALARFAADADLLLVRSGRISALPELFDAPRCRAFLDGNPGQTQIDHVERRADAAPLERFELLFTLGLNIGSDDCPIPCAGLRWHPLPRPVDVSMWPRDPRDNGRFTTVSTWKGRASFSLNGTDAGDKAGNWTTYLSLPRRSARPMEIALRMSRADEPDKAPFEHNGWHISDPRRLRSFDDYRDFVAGSRAEFSVAHNRYVEFRTGWFSDRSAVYLACGKPVVVQSTGFEAHLPVGEGLLAFTDADEALECIRAVDAAYARHSQAAYAIAQAHFAPERVLGRILRLAADRMSAAR